MEGVRTNIFETLEVLDGVGKRFLLKLQREGDNFAHLVAAPRFLALSQAMTKIATMCGFEEELLLSTRLSHFELSCQILAKNLSQTQSY